MPDIQTIPLNQIAIPENRARSYDPLKAQALAGSIAAQGLFHAITVRPAGDAYALVSGLHRYRAVEMLGMTGIAARVSELDDDAARLAEVMENLARAELIPLDRCQHLYDLKVVWEQMHPDFANGGGDQTGGPSWPTGSEQPEVFGFASHVAEQIGLSKRAINRAVGIWKGLSKDSRPRLYGTDPAKKQTGLKALSELSPARQGKVLDLIFDEQSEVGNVAGAVAVLKDGVVMSANERRFASLSQGLRAVSDEAFDLLIGEQTDRVIASLKRMGRL